MFAWVPTGNGENIETEIYNIINYIPSIQSLNSSDMLITINNRIVYPIILYTELGTYLMHIVFHYDEFLCIN